MEVNQALTTSGPNVENPDEEQLQRRVNHYPYDSPQNSPTQSSPYSSSYHNRIELVEKQRKKHLEDVF